MGAGKTTALISTYNTIKTFSDMFPSIEKISYTVFKSPVDENRFTEKDSIESRLGANIEAIVTDRPDEYLKERMNSDEVNIVFIADAQFFTYESIKELISEVKQNENIYLYLDGLDLSFRGEPFPHKDFKGGTMYDTMKLLPPGSIELLTAECTLDGTSGATHTFRHIIYDGEKVWAPYYDKLFRVGSQILKGVKSEDPRARGHENQDISFSYGACHQYEFYAPGKEEWYFVLGLVHSKEAVDINEVKKTAFRRIEDSTLDEILQRMQEEKIIYTSDGGIHWIKNY